MNVTQRKRQKVFADVHLHWRRGHLTSRLTCKSSPSHCLAFNSMRSSLSWPHWAGYCTYIHHTITPAIVAPSPSNALPASGIAWVALSQMRTMGAIPCAAPFHPAPVCRSLHVRISARKEGM